MLGERLECATFLAAVSLLFCLLGPASAADVSQDQFRRHLTDALTTATPPRLPPDVARSLERVNDRLIVEASRLTWQDGQLNWSLRQRRTMTAADGLEALQALDGVLRHVLSEVPGRDGAKLLSADEASRVVDRSKLSIAKQPHVWELTSEQFEQAIRRALRDPGQRAKVARMKGDFEVPEPDAGYLEVFLRGGIVTWPLQPSMRNGQWQPPRIWRLLSPARQQELMEREMEKQTREYAAKAKPYEESLRSFVVAALSEIPDPELGMPLLNPQDASSIPVRVVVSIGIAQGAAAAGVTGIPLVSSSASRGAVLRTLRSIQFVGIRQKELWTAEKDFMRRPHFAVDGPPQLVIDTGAFSGAVINKVAFSPDGRLLAVAGDVVRIWELDGGQLLHTLRGHKSWDATGGCTDLVFTPDGRQFLVAAAGYDRCLRVYDVAAPEQPREVHEGHDGHIERLAISRDGEWLVSYGFDRRLQIWNWPDREVVATYPTNDPVDHLSFPTIRPNVLAVAGNGNYEWMATRDGLSVKAQDRGILESRLTSGRQWPHGGAPHPFAIDLDWSEERWLIGGYSREDGKDHYWCGYWTGANAEPQAVYRTGYYVTACDLSTDGRWAATADALGNVAVWDTESGEVRHRFASRVKPVYSVHYDQAAQRIDLGRTPYDGSRWNVNHYGPLQQTFDLRRRTLQSRDESEAPAAITAQGGYELELRLTRNGDRELTTKNSQGSVLGSLPFSGSSRLLPLWHSFLRGDAMDIDNAVLLGSEDGSLVCLDPETMLSRRALIGHTDRVWSASQTADHRLLISGGGDGAIHVWRLEPPQNWGNLAILADDDGKVHHVFPDTPTARVIRVGDFVRMMDNSSLAELRQEFSATKEWRYKAGDEVTVELQRGKDVFERTVVLSRTGDVGRPLFSLFITADEKDWVLWTPQGYYDASPGGHRLVGWHVNRGETSAADFFPFEEFREKYHRPSLFDALFRLGDLELAMKEVDQDSIAAAPPMPSELVQAKPSVTIISPASALITGESELEIVAEVRVPSDVPVHAASVLVNGKPIPAKDIELVSPPAPRPGEARPSRYTPPEQTFIVRHQAALESGTNDISVVAGSDSSHSRGATVQVDYRSSLVPDVKPRMFVLAVGVSDYQEDAFDLAFAAEDARAFADLCRQQPSSQYASVETRVLCDQEASEAAIEDGMDWLAESVEARDVGVLLLCGHGVMDDRQNFYFATHDMDPTRLRATCLRWSSVHDLARDLRGSFVLFADTCHAGGVMSVTTIVGDPVGELARDDIGAVVFASCGARAVSYEDPQWGHGAFTKALLESIGSIASDRDTPPDGLLSLSELEHNLDRRVQSLTQGRQRPVSARPAPISDRDLFALPQ